MLVDVLGSDLFSHSESQAFANALGHQVQGRACDDPQLRRHGVHGSRNQPVAFARGDGECLDLLLDHIVTADLEQSARSVCEIASPKRQELIRAGRQKLVFPNGDEVRQKNVLSAQIKSLGDGGCESEPARSAADRRVGRPATGRRGLLS
jgi:hypothetical protein